VKKEIKEETLEEIRELIGEVKRLRSIVAELEKRCSIVPEIQELWKQ
jgi:chorismate mutase